MKMTKQGTAKTTTASEKKEEPVITKASTQTQKASKSTLSSSLSTGCRVWPD